ncbi:MAG: NADH-quinone oxidoreductase subunit M [Verrucomicrobiales bacterium]|jgi:NADH-quinone oxidoreductase subunit M|nr:NADH-quinone oxidoreductase subunit M [Verrucomicrobiales bacterium]MDP6677344.1 NADH-quinone oxidoreductase subunit M [Verrucomicrobiota bacterium]MDP6752537.1 NADH-quinone oxidoreductase subunit M [Verrucomicrobiota bacterium]
MITALTLAPLVAAILIVAMPAQRARAVALAGALVSFGLTAWLLTQFNGTLIEAKRSWIPDLGIDYHVGLDGTNALVLFLAALLAPIVVWISWGHSDRPKTYFALLSLQFTGLFGTFTALNFFHWFIYWELALVPAFFLIKLFGQGVERHKAAINFFLFTVLGSVAMLLGFLFLYQETGSFNFIELPEKVKSLEVSSLIFVAILAGLWVKVPLAPLHIWQAPAYAAAPTPVVILLTGVMSKMGVYGFLRLIVPIFPAQLQQHADVLLGFALLTILWGAFLALRQTDLKKLLAFSSLNHVAYCVLGIGALGVALNGPKIDAHELARQGVILQMFAHGLSAAGLFYLVGLLEQRAGSRDRDGFGGLCSVTPRFAAMFYILTFCSLGLPFLAGFAAEFLIFSGSFAVAPKVTAMATLGLLATAVFLLTMLQRVFTGPVNEQHRSMPDLTRNEILILTPILILVFWAGIYPKTWLAFSQLMP